MDGDRALVFLERLLWVSLLVAGPVLLAALVTGLLVSILQVATQLQEMTLSYIPKLVVSAIVLIVLGPWMISQVTQFAISMIVMIPDLG